jgi:signal transduction histidine kinase
VSDDGRGFDPGAVSEGFGLPGMRARVAEIGGNLRISTAPGAGTLVTADLAAGVSAGVSGDPADLSAGDPAGVSAGGPADVSEEVT